MKNKAFLSISTAAVLSFFLSFGSIACLVTAFSLEVSMPTLAFFCAACCGACCVCFHFRRGGAAIVCILALLGGYLWQDGRLVNQTLRLGYIITSIYNRAYGWGYWGDPYAAEGVLLPLCVLSGLIGLFAAFSLTRRRFFKLTVLLSLLPLGLCLVVTDTVPDIRWLFLLLLGVLLLLFTQNVRKRTPHEAIRLTWLLSAPLALALALLLAAIPQSSYDRQDHFEDITNTAVELFSELPYVDISQNGDISLSLTREIPSQVNLQSIGPNNRFSIRVMEVTAERSGKLYLRGRDFDTYTGIEWTARSNRSETFSILSYSPSVFYDAEPVYNGELSIRTFGRRSIKYLPYYPASNLGLTGGASPNSDDSTSYSYSWYSLPADYEAYIEEKWDFLRSGNMGFIIDEALFSSQYSSYDAEITSPYYYNSVSAKLHYFLSLPAITEDWAGDYLEAHLSISPDDSIITTANAIADLVRSSARYDLDTQRMPGSQSDFAKWFLEGSSTGYCVHYATATAVLLRAAGIASRYVEGYTVNAVAGETVTVTEKDAHAWVEYYIDGIGWVVLESTASASVDPDEDIPAWVSDETEQTGETTEATASVQEESAPAESNEGTTSVTQPQPPAQEPSGIDPTLPVTICLVTLLLIQWPLRIYWRNSRQGKGRPNARALKKWRHAQRLAKLLRQTPPEELLELALRAKFSQHTLSDLEVGAFDAFQAEAIGAMKRKRWWMQVYYRLFWAAY